MTETVSSDANDADNPGTANEILAMKTQAGTVTMLMDEKKDEKKVGDETTEVVLLMRKNSTMEDGHVSQEANDADNDMATSSTAEAVAAMAAATTTGVMAVANSLQVMQNVATCAVDNAGAVNPVPSWTVVTSGVDAQTIL